MPSTHTRKRRKSPPVHCSKFKIKKFGLTDLDIDNERVKSQCIAYPRYGDSNAVFKTSFIKLTQYGIPQSTAGKPETYYDTPESRSFLKVPFDPEQTGCQELRGMCEQIDTYMQKKKNKQPLFTPVTPNAYKSFEYQPLVRTPPPLDEFSKKNPKYNPDRVRFQYCKMKFDIDYITKNLKTVVFRRDSMEDKPVKVEGIKTVADLDDLISWGSEVRVIGMFNKMWAAKKPLVQGMKMKRYGITMKIIQIEVIPREHSSLHAQFSSYGFDSDSDSDEEDSEKKAETKKQANDESDEESDEEQDNKQKAEDNKDEESDEESDEEPDDESESEEEEEPPKKKKSSKKKKRKRR